MTSRPMLAAFLAVFALSPSAWAAQADRLTLADAEVVAQVNVRQILQTPVVKKHALDPLKLLLRRNDELQQLLTAAGVDPLRDIDTISVSATGNPMAGGKLRAVVRGRFDLGKAEIAATDYAKKHPGRLKILKVDERPLWEITSDGQSFYAAFAGKDALVMTTSKNDPALAVPDPSKEAPRLSKEMQTALDQIKGGESVWLALAATDDLKQLLKSDDNTKDFAASLQAVTGTLELTDDAQLTLVVHTNSPEAATRIKGKLDELMPLLTFLGAGKDKSGQIAKEVLDNIKLTTDKNDVSIRLKITDAQLGKVHKKDR
jgi:hypothetical protein